MSNNETWIYHQIKAPKGKVVLSSEADEYYKKGWVDTPAKYGKGIRGRIYSILMLRHPVTIFLKSEWKWLFGTAISIVALYIAFLKL